MIRYIKKKYLSPAADRAAARRKVGLLLSLLGVGLNLLLCAVKCTAGAISGSIAITADGINNLADTAACLLVILGLWLAERRPCRRFPFGYGRFEYLSGMVIGGVVLFLGGRLMAESVSKIIHPAPIDGKPIVLVMLALSILVKGAMYVYNKRIGALIDSAGMRAAAMDALADCVATLAIIIAVIVEKLTGLTVDGYTGALVALCILWAGFVAVKDSVVPLLGEGLDEDTKARIECIALRRRNIRRVRGIAVHDYGPQQKLLTMTLTLSGGDAQTVSALQAQLRAELGMESVIGIDGREIAAGRIIPPDPAKNNTGEHKSNGA